MAKRRKSSSGRFALGMIVYALTFIVFLAIGLRIFWGMIDSYEKSQPSHAIDRYIQSFDSEHIRALELTAAFGSPAHGRALAFSFSRACRRGRISFSSPPLSFPFGK